MIQLPVHTIQDIRDLKPCYDPVTGLDRHGRRHNNGYLPEDWRGTALDILKVADCPAEDRLWLVLRSSWIDERTLRLFAVWCARWAIEHYWPDPDPRSVAACDVAERYANGQASAEELGAAQAAAWPAAWPAAWTASAAWAAADAADEDAAWAANAAGAAARAAARAAQIEQLFRMLEEQS